MRPRTGTPWLIALLAVLLVLGPFVWLAAGILLRSAHSTQQLAELRRRVAETGSPPPAVSVPARIAGELRQGRAAAERCCECHSFTSLTTAPGQAQFAASLAPAQRDAALAALRKAKAPQSSSCAPAGGHPGEWLRWHAPARFGCVACHGGDPQAGDLAGSGHLPAAKYTAALSQLENDVRGPGQPRGEAFDALIQRSVVPDETALITPGAEVYASCGRCHPGADVAGAATLSLGRQLIRELNCAACHQLPADLQTDLPPGRAASGPALGHVGYKLSYDLLARWPLEVGQWQAGQPADPAYARHVYGRMPQYRLPEDKARALAAYLSSSSKPVPPVADAQPGLRGDARAGAKLVREARCANCHLLPGPVEATPGGGIGPSLERIGERVSGAWIEGLLADPQAIYPGTRMPRYRLTAQQRADISAWLLSFATADRAAAAAVASSTVSTDPGEVAQGRELFGSLGCSGCHSPAAERPAQFFGPSLENFGTQPRSFRPPAAQHFDTPAEYARAKLARPQDFGMQGPASGKMPHFDLSAEQREAIALALAALAPPPSGFAPRELRPDSPLLPAHLTAEQLFADPLNSPWWPVPIAPQGTAPPALAGTDTAAPQDGDWLTTAERDLRPEACAVCHREQYEQWRGSRHAKAMSPGVSGQLIEWVTQRQGELYDCLRCHARLSEQRLLLPDGEGGWSGNAAYREEQLQSAHGCVNCHVRELVRHGPLKPFGRYLWDSEAVLRHPLQRESWLADSRFCAACHQFPASQRLASGAPPLENTYEEWRTWAATAKQVKSCQDCHMEKGSHGFKGIHDKDFVAAAARISTSHSFAGGRARASITLSNAGNGHHLPTYVTPRIWLQAWFSDKQGQQIAASFRDLQIGRDADSRPTAGGGTEWYDRSDTRIPAEGSASFSYDEPVPAGAAELHLEIFVEPDHFYYNAYGQWLAQPERSPAAKALLEQARAETAPFSSGYYLLQQSWPLP